MKRLLLICLIAQSSLAVAEETATLELKHTSTFDLQPGERNPFWPIGWKPAANSGAVSGPSIPASTFVVSSITLDPGARFAIINGKAIAEGQQFGLQLGSQIQQISVKKIEDGRVVLLHGDEEIVVPLRRR